jgi:transposase
MSQRVTIALTDEQRAELERVTRAGTCLARTQAKARALLLADRARGERRSNRAVAEATGLHPIAVGRVLRRFAAEGLEAALHDRPRPGAEPKVTGDVEAHLVTLACSDPPEGQKRWTLRLLAQRMVELGYVDTLCHETVRQVLKKANCSRGGRSNGVFRPRPMAPS